MAATASSVLDNQTASADAIPQQPPGRRAVCAPAGSCVTAAYQPTARWVGRLRALAAAGPYSLQAPRAAGQPGMDECMTQPAAAGRYTESVLHLAAARSIPYSQRRKMNACDFGSNARCPDAPLVGMSSSISAPLPVRRTRQVHTGPQAQGCMQRATATAPTRWRHLHRPSANAAHTTPRGPSMDRTSSDDVII